MTMKLLSQEEHEWLLANADALLLFKCEKSPSISELCVLRQNAASDGIDLDPNLFSHLIEFSVLKEVADGNEHKSYPVIAKYLDAIILAGPNKPDLITKDGRPVEVKVGCFDEKALKQLNRYMGEYNSANGIACGKSLVVELPKNIDFVQIHFDLDTREFLIIEEGVENV